ncbi:MAG: Zn-ribbon domain-containing OB-fold protein [Chloroflexi bacterium]|nr:Zn-ribbon domain-containing OB-fold protein [Chloroflexota bacterium]
MTVQYNPEQKIPHPALWGVLYRSSTPFWEAAKQRELKLQRCKGCGTFLNPPRPMCPKCHSMELEWVPSKGKGKVYSWVTYHESPHPAFKAPYAVVLVELEEGPRLVSNMTEVRPEEIYIGMPVQVVFEDVEKDLILPKFRKAG